MSNKKANKAKKANSPTTNSTAGSSSPSSPPAREKTPAPPEPPTPPDEIPGLTHPTEILLGLVFEAWMHSLLSPCLHWMTRTFGHHRAGDRYDTNKIFDQMDILGQGDHGKLLDDFRAFRDTCFEDLARRRLADRKKNA